MSIFKTTSDDYWKQWDIDKEKAKNPEQKITVNTINSVINGTLNVTQVYQETVSKIEKSEDISEEQKSSAKKILDTVNEYAKPLLPTIANVLLKAFGIASN